MSNRTIRINELVQREISAILRQHYQSDSVAVTITEVRVSPDLRDGRVFVAIVGDATAVEQKFRWLRRQTAAIRAELAKRIVLKFLPKLEFVLDTSTVSSTRVLQLLDEIEKPKPT